MNERKDSSKVTVARSTLVIFGLIAVASPYAGIFLWNKLSPRLNLDLDPVRGCISIELRGSEKDEDVVFQPSTSIQIDALMSGEDYAAISQQLSEFSDIDLENRYLFANGADELISSGATRHNKRVDGITNIVKLQSVDIWFDEGTCSEN